jgi:hypothetical protein
VVLELWTKNPFKHLKNAKRVFYSKTTLSRCVEKLIKTPATPDKNIRGQGGAGVKQ